MGMTNAGAIAAASALVGDGGITLFNNANAYLGVGDGGATAFSAAQTDLQAASNKLRKAMDASYPTRTNGAITFRSTFGTSDANWDWSEWGIFNAGSGGTMLQRKVESPSLGTKTNTSTWTFSVTVTLAAA